MVFFPRLFGSTLLLILLSEAILAQVHDLSATINSEGVLVVQGDHPVLFYQRSPKSLDGRMPRSGYVHPLYGLEGQVLTEDFPADHLHHRGVFWAWHQIWVGDRLIGDPWLCKEFRWDVESVDVNNRSDSIELNAVVNWRSPEYVDDAGNSVAIVNEQTKIIVHPRQQSHRVIDFDISLRALVDNVRIGGSDDIKGYGGFSPRIKLNSDQKFSGAAGELVPSLIAMDVGPWVDISQQNWGVTMISHANNPGDPNQWILRRRRSMQNAVYPGREPASLSTLSTTRLRYRLVVHDGNMTADRISELNESFITDR